MTGDGTVYTGTPGAAGVAVGRLHLLAPAAPGVDAPDVAGPDKLRAAFDAVAAGLRDRAAAIRAAAEGDGAARPGVGEAGQAADILEAVALIADDPDLRAAAAAECAAGERADRAVVEAAAQYAELLARLDDPTLAARAADVRLVGQRVVQELRGGARALPDGPVLLAAAELGADDLLDPQADVLGGVSSRGGPNAHVAIVARALGVPLLFGVDLPAADEGAEAVLDGGAGVLTVRPGAAVLAAALAAAESARQRRRRLAGQRDRPAVTADGQPVTLLVNVSTAADAEAGLAAGAAGAGLIRTELPFLQAARWPTRAEHVAALRPVLAALAGRTATVRVLDFAPDKLPPFLAAAALAHRGLQLLLAHPVAFADQLAAILDTGADTRLKIMVPMVASADELVRCRELLVEVAGEHGAGVPPLGAMIELPQAVRDIDAIAAAADFLSIGSNDLTAALLGLDRRDPALTPARAAEPPVLDAIARVVAAGARHGRDVSVCGDAAGDPAVVPALLAAGCRILSAAPTALDEVRAAVRDTTLTPSGHG
ncbi:hypothetical protein Cs7R123_56960 [Catellatospora sp. TT07R-123]|uniref:putative PEP-binding protein n=1 Tax=Catellatospora sp. TT07R-123 TaxID=2733863 RepID=UPI001B00A350|nr:putative PEP-binding protein [Catellatospora sp. TT07R-123]GHJ48354.1 hypothetical protein Cs7R123_56960 [Catellatospora sp. TT07R-123]